MSNDDAFIACWELLLSAISTAWSWFYDLFPPYSLTILFLIFVTAFVVANIIRPSSASIAESITSYKYRDYSKRSSKFKKNNRG